MSKRDYHFRFFREKFKKTKKFYTFQIVSKTAFFSILQYQKESQMLHFYTKSKKNNTK
jgi:hypothetical protein